MKNIDEKIKKINKVLEYSNNLINADIDYSKLMVKLKLGNISDKELETLSFGTKELEFWANKIESTVNMKRKQPNDLKNSNEK
ncbi:hypothetical protein LNI89_10235 [Tenacibaculum dicentrarchi]|nr:hypothetical protein [Tenacibaculum dicentrarchi]MCD8420860.1 hypothetical protein [Tenacibaculum dicentrarchi]